MPLGGAVQQRPTVEQEMAKFKGFSVNEGETITPEAPEDLNPVVGKNTTAKEAAALAANEKKPAAVKVEKLTDAESEAALDAAEKAKGADLSDEEVALALETAQNKKNVAAGHKASKHSVQERINKATKRAATAERRADAIATENAALKAQLAAGNKAPLTEDKKPANDADAEPDPTKFEYGELDPKYIRALARWETKQEIATSAKNQEKTQQTAKEQKTAKEFRAALDEFKDKGSELYEDFEEIVVQGAKDEVWPLSDELGAALLSSEFGQQIAYELASDPKEAEKINKLPPARQLAWLGRQEAKLEAAGSGAKTEAEKAAEIAAAAAKKAGSSTVRETKAPTPVQRARGTGSNSSVSGDTSDFAAFEAQWREQNKR